MRAGTEHSATVSQPPCRGSTRVTMATGSTSARMASCSSGLSNGLSGTAVAPSFQMPSIATAKVQWLGSTTATRSPGLTPSPDSVRAKPAARACSSW